MNDTAIRNAVLGSLQGGQAAMTFDAAVADFPPEHYNTKPTNVPYSFWHLLEHIRICNRDILDYAVSPDYRELDWPAEVWPARDATADEAAWNATIEAIHRDLATFRELVASPGSDLTSLALHASGNGQHTLFREVLVATDHIAYHLGEFAILRQVMGFWPADHK
jgi:ribosomal protein S19